MHLAAKSGENGQGVAPTGGASGPNERLYWPAASALTARLRRLITAYQRSNRREQLRQEALNRPDGRRRRRRDFMPSITMVTEAGGGAAYIQDGAGVFMAEGSPYMAKGSAYFTKGGQFIPEASPVITASSLMADGAMYYKERRQRYGFVKKQGFYCQTSLYCSSGTFFFIVFPFFNCPIPKYLNLSCPHHQSRAWTANLRYKKK